LEHKVGDIITLEATPLSLDCEVRDVKKGGFGIIYIVYTPQLKGFMAVKSFQDKYFESEDVITNFYREAEIWMKLEKHENIVEAFYIVELDDRPHVFLEYVDGGNLDERLVRGGLSIPEALYFAIQFCDGMIYANSVDLGGSVRGIVHRDIKPKNIMLTKKGVLKVTDFGLVKALGTSTAETPMGTPEYMSPEQFHTMDVDTRSDIYSFGVVLYQMLTGQPPFYISTKNSRERWEFCRRHHWETEPRPPRQIIPDIPATLEEIVLKCLEKKINDRYQSFKELREELMEFYRSQFAQIPEVKKRIYNLAATELYTELYNRGMSLYNLGRHGEAIPFFDRALEIDPRKALSWVGKGKALAALNRNREAIECFDEALEINPGDALTLASKGMSLFILQKYRDALLFFHRALEWDPKYALAWYGKGQTLVMLHRYREAIECLDKALEIDPRLALAWAIKGMVLYKLGRLEDALKCFRKAAEIDPSFRKRYEAFLGGR